MSLNPHPLLSTLRRNPTGAVLVALQIGITLAILVNAAAMVVHAIRKMNRPTGFDTHDTFVIYMSALSKELDVASASRKDLAYLERLPGVAGATVTTGVPLTEDGGDLLVGRRPGSKGAAVASSFLPVDQHGLRALGVRLVAGRNFHADEIIAQSPKHPLFTTGEVIVTQSLARALFPHESALGQTVYLMNDTPQRIIGITRNFMGPELGQPEYNTVLIPEILTQFGGYDLLVRTRPGQLDAVLREAKRDIGTAHQNAVFDSAGILEHLKLRFYSGLRHFAVFLTFVTIVMLALCCLGTFGLGTFNVGSRTRQIGIRRALGARRRDVVALFLAENALTVTAGAVMGCVLALGIGQWLTDHDGVARLDPWYLLVGVAVLALTSQLAAWQPARRAARIPPSVATRTI